jgi:hypothetical protein
MECLSDCNCASCYMEYLDENPIEGLRKIIREQNFEMASLRAKLNQYERMD